MTVRRRVNELKMDPAQINARSGDGKSLVLASLYDSEREANRRYLAERFPSAATSRRQTLKGISEQGALERGRAYGASVSLSPQLKGR